MDIENQVAKDRMLVIRLTGEQHESIEQFCRQKRVSKSELTRRAILSVVDAQ